MIFSIRQLIHTFLIALCFFLASCSHFPSRIEPPTITLAGIEPLNMTLFEQTYRLQLRVQNPNDFDLPLEAMNYVLELNGSRFANGVSREHVTVPAYDSAIIETEVISSTVSLFSQIQDFALKGNGNFEYRLIGDVNVGNWDQRIPFDYDGQINLNPASR
ncbi:MAG: LEA type 2 family protein [Gammaproteobacteria bacterium]|nr:LEA type 2 family protein [Gammaproteobacteria bacterium]